MTFIEPFRQIEDGHVSPRYHYGQLRLSRLNFWAKVFLCQWQFRKATWQYADYFARFYAPLLFLLAMVGTVLSATQVGLAARPSWPILSAVSIWFSVVCILAMLLVGIVSDRRDDSALTKQLLAAWHPKRFFFSFFS